MRFRDFSSKGNSTMKLLAVFVLVVMASAAQGAVTADHIAVATFDSIPESSFQDIRNNYRIFYGHTSHGSQIVTGLGMLAVEDASRFAPPSIDEYSGDLGHLGSLVWEEQTRSWLAVNPETNMVVWSWCAGASDNTAEGIDIYLNAMNQLETDFPHVVFVYMTGHLDGTGVDGDLYRNNNQIRAYCLANDKILYDFADIESWDPAGNYYPDETDACNWCLNWCSAEICPTCAECAHSHCFNCYLKGKGFWWLLARIEGWEPTPNERTSLGSFKSLYR